MCQYIGSSKIPKVRTGSTTINNQNKTITKNGTYTADTGYTGLGEVTVIYLQQLHCNNVKKYILRLIK